MNVVAGNEIGTNAAGTAAVPNATDGVLISLGAQNNWIGVNPIFGPENADQGNLISGNTNDGVFLSDAGTSGNTVAGNLIGTDHTGTLAIPNYAGVEIDGGATGNLIGTNGDGVSDALERNIISGNFQVGVWITGAGTSNNVVAGDYIGTNSTGMSALPNGTAPISNAKTDLTGDGVAILAGASDNRIGTNGTDADTAGERNIISGNDDDGIEIGGSGSSGNLVAGNYIGLASSGTAPMGNDQAGILLNTGASQNTIGGITAALRNVIGGNANRGMYINTAAGSSTPTTQNVIEGNYIGTDASGMVPMTNNLNDAISIDTSPGNTIGGTVAGAGNLLDAAGDSGVYIYGDYALGPYASAAGTLIAGNIIGLAADGVTAAGFGDGYDGIAIDSAPDTTIGGSVAAARNIISNNTTNGGEGILVVNFEEADGAYGTVIQGNYIGTDITGTLARGNNVGIDIEGSSSTLVGTDGQDGAADALEGNLISGNLTVGIRINASSSGPRGSQYAGAAQNVVAGNRIGTNTAGTAALGNNGCRRADRERSDQQLDRRTTRSTGPRRRRPQHHFGQRRKRRRDHRHGHNRQHRGRQLYRHRHWRYDRRGQPDRRNHRRQACICSIPPPATRSADLHGRPRAPASRNVISGNAQSGIEISDSGATGNLIQGNLIGTNAAGTVALSLHPRELRRVGGQLQDSTASTVGGVAGAT